MKQTSLTKSDFIPRLFLRNRHLQSILASSRVLVPPHRLLLEATRELIIESSVGSRLLAHYSRHPKERGLMIIIHGWEGSSSSAYVLTAGAFFFNRGFSVCRLNLRDHGESHHLNEGLFHGALLEETFDAVSELARQAGELPVFLLGFSLGANFSLRIAIKHTKTPVERLKGVFAVSPPLDPYKTTLAIDEAPALYRKYFLRKWKRSLKKKQKLFPGKYSFNSLFDAKTCMQLTADMMSYFPEFPSYRDYFSLYTLGRESFKELCLPVTIFSAADDPVIPAGDFHPLADIPLVKVMHQAFGGHCGFIDLFPHRRWYNEKIMETAGAVLKE
jgi:hypothetical protein